MFFVSFLVITGYALNYVHVKNEGNEIIILFGVQPKQNVVNKSVNRIILIQDNITQPQKIIAIFVGYSGIPYCRLKKAH
jgi:hypothetical protein